MLILLSGEEFLLIFLFEAFDNDPLSRQYQDVGLDGLANNDELLFFEDNYIDLLESAYGTNSPAYQNAINDPSGDDFHYFRGTDFDNASTDILARYKRFNNTDGNSVTSEQSIESYPTAASSQPNTEDINRDHTLSETESYFQYKLNLFPGMGIGDSYISDVLETTVKTENGNNRNIKWYQFRVPVYLPDNVISMYSGF